MLKKKLLKYLNVVIAVLILNQVLSGLLHGALFHKLFSILHKGSGIVLFIAVAIHVALNWGWVKTNFLKRDNQRGSA